ncbi:TetR/AcrR family transcriptional regulator [Parafrankia sp. EUN1f]|uniref:TetR/AcrR family transcriptional regulator n=1 Tax=Parafrankia sp. EUN1f TaxID=102897 RepID=UPI0001C46004|nr:transcriptional regulator, TetR family [Parafrankia sp. EUN1f]
MGLVAQERVDAARNRAAILAAAADLFDREGTETVSMSDIAEAAGVGKGTVFRRFGDRTALIEAVLQPRVNALSQCVEHGPPPLGPGASPADAMRSYLDALLDFVVANRALIRALEHRGPNAYYANASSRYWIAELSRRIAAARPAEDADYLAHVLFTALRADVVDYLMTAREMSLQRVRAGLHQIAGV